MTITNLWKEEQMISISMSDWCSSSSPWSIGTFLMHLIWDVEIYNSHEAALYPSSRRPVMWQSILGLSSNKMNPAAIIWYYACMVKLLTATLWNMGMDLFSLYTVWVFTIQCNSVRDILFADRYMGVYQNAASQYHALARFVWFLSSALVSPLHSLSPFPQG